MAASLSQKPFALLRDIEARSRQNAIGLPQQVEVRRTWSGIGFKVNGVRLVAAVSDIDEILDFPSITRVPGALPWVRGLANNRGTLLPIFDLSGFIDGTVTDIGRDTRVLSVKHGDIMAGLVVDEVVGLRHFFEEETTDRLPEVSNEMSGFLAGAYRQGNAHWAVFDFERLAVSNRFLQVAAHV